jgi:hypothetical protein
MSSQVVSIFKPDWRQLLVTQKIHLASGLAPEHFVDTQFSGVQVSLALATTTKARAKRAKIAAYFMMTDEVCQGKQKFYLICEGRISVVTFAILIKIHYF